MPQKTVKNPAWLTIGQTARRTGVPASALRFYESRGLIQAERQSGNQRMFARAMIRRISLIKVAQNLGLSLSEIHEEMKCLPERKAPTQKEWQMLSQRWRKRLDARISSLERLRDQLDGCIGCGCLSLTHCELYNPDDKMADQGSGPQLLTVSEVDEHD